MVRCLEESVGCYGTRHHLRENYGVDSVAVESLLKPHSWVPTSMSMTISCDLAFTNVTLERVFGLSLCCVGTRVLLFTNNIHALHSGFSGTNLINLIQSLCEKSPWTWSQQNVQPWPLFSRSYAYCLLCYARYKQDLASRRCFSRASPFGRCSCGGILKHHNCKHISTADLIHSFE